MDTYTLILDSEAILVNGIVNHYALKLARAHECQDTQTARQIAEYIEGNYGTKALDDVSNRAAVMVLRGMAS